ncbi:MAG: hypothetical protein ACRD1V_04475, partial [Vicinamibacterales bacterium]
MIDLEIETGAGPRRLSLSTYLSAADEERAQEQSCAWIKALRHLRLDGVPFRRRWTVRGDSLWWFAELYLHKTQTILALHRALLAFDAMMAAERPSAIRCRDRRFGWLVRRLADIRDVRYEGPAEFRTRATRMAIRAAALHAAGRLSPRRWRRHAAAPATVAAFIHKAFWRGDGRDGRMEAYIGPVLQQVQAALGTPQIAYVAIGPRTNFRARRWWSPLGPEQSGAALPIEAFARRGALAASQAIWRMRHDVRRALWASAEMRAHATILACDCWPAVREELAGIALLQFPWSARVMDEAGAALDALTPRVAVTYAEAGGWGRALALESRRRRIPLVGLQHGFIYRHWLNYRHEPDEMLPDPGNPADTGFPRPALTLLYDAHAMRHLMSAGHFPEIALRVTGSPGQDALVAGVRGATAAQTSIVRRLAGAADSDLLVVVATKQREAARVLPALVAAVRDLPHVRVAIKPHPAETAEVYAPAVSGASNVTVLSRDAELAPLLAAASAVVTVNSTVAIYALRVGVPSLVLWLPNNLSPFVETAAMA